MIIFTDGAATMRLENGEYVRENGGAAIVVVENNEVVFTNKFHFDNTTNNFCELYAIYAALEYFKESDDKELEINSDSAYCINIFTQWVEGWFRKGWTRGKGQAIENLEIIQKIYFLIKELSLKNKEVKFVKVKGHSNNKFNCLADELAVAAKEEK